MREMSEVAVLWSVIFELHNDATLVTSCMVVNINKYKLRSKFLVRMVLA